MEGSVGGWYLMSGNAENGSVTTENGIHIENGNIFGGYTHDGNASGNEAALTGTWVIGGPSNGGDVRENHVTIQNGQKGAEVEYSVMGGYTLRGNAAGNTVTMSDEILRDEEGTRVHGGLYGGLTEWGNADGNSVTVTNVILDGKNLTDVGNGTDAIYGGRTENGNASGNTVTVENSVVYDRVYGGWAAGGNAEKNAVELAGETGAADTIVGGFSEDGAANGNQVTTLAGGTGRRYGLRGLRRERRRKQHFAEQGRRHGADRVPCISHDRRLCDGRRRSGQWRMDRKQRRLRLRTACLGL